MVTEGDSFWKLNGANVIASQSDFYQHLAESKHLSFTIYQPDELTRIVKNRTQRIEEVTFEEVSFSKTKIFDVIFRGCTFKKCQLIATTFENCEFHGCKFISTNTHKIAFRKTYIDPLSFDKCLDWKKHQNIGVHLYQALMNNSHDEEQIEFERDAQFLFFRWKRYQDGYEVRRTWTNAKTAKERFFIIRTSGKVLRRLGWEKLFGCGIRMRYFLRTIIVVLAMTTFMNFGLRNEFGLLLDGEPISTWSEAFYFTTVSLTTLGYGDITPSTSLGRLVASIQSIFGFSLFALLASMFFRRVAP